MGLFAPVVAAVLLAALLVVVGSAQAAFPGRNGLLAVQPLGGGGVVLIDANGRGERRICAGSSNECSLSGRSAARPRWSPDGRALVLDESESHASNRLETPVVAYTDGSCLNCSFGYATPVLDASFTNDPAQFTAISQVVCSGCGQAGDHLTEFDYLTEFGVDGIAKQVLLSGDMSDPVWSSGGQLAVVRGGWIWVGSPVSLRRLARGSDPSWSPGGSKIVFERKGWLLVGDLRSGAARRLVRGSAPAWSPDGRWIAFFDKKHRLSVDRSSGGSVNHVGGVTGRTVDWQPIPATPSPPCPKPPGATVAAGGNTATVTFDFRQSLAPGFGWAAMGCLKADGRQRLLASGASTFIPSLFPSPTQAAVAGKYAAIAMVTACGRVSESRWHVAIGSFDLQTGAAVPHRGGESATAGDYVGDLSVCDNNIDLVVGKDAVSAIHSTVHENIPCSCAVEQIQASDAAGVRTLDSATEPNGTPTALTNLTLTGDTLAWKHNGTSHSAKLKP